MFVRHVKGNVKAGADLEIGEKTLVVGVNGCHRKGQSILMFDGSTKAVEDVVVGDQLVGLGSPRTVLRLCRGEAPMFAVIPRRGEAFVVNAKHVLSLVACTAETGVPEGTIVDVTVEDWLTWPHWRQAWWLLFRSAAEFADTGVELPIDPYFLGVLLGDGSLQSTVCVHKPDPEIAALAREQAVVWGLTPRPILKDGGIRGWRFSTERGSGENPITAELRKLGLWGTTCDTKFVPEIYLRSSMGDRLGILAGLLDTDGSLGGSRTTFDFISKSRRLAENVTFLARSVGLTARIRSKHCWDQHGTGGIYWRVCIGGNTHVIPTRIARKQAEYLPIPSGKARGGRRNNLRTGFKIEPTGEVEPFYGFTLDGDGRYLLGDFTVTHNSGKSSVVNIIELALTSRAGDIAGRVDIAREADVMTLARYGEKALYAEVVFDGGEKATYTIEGTTAKAKKAIVTRPQNVTHEDVLPIRALREALLGSPQTARKFLLGKVGGGSMADVEALIPAPLLPIFRGAGAGYAAGTPVSDVLVGIIEYAGKQQREASATARSSREAAKLVSGGRMAPPSDGDLTQAKARMTTAREALVAAQAAENAESEIAKVQAEITRTEHRADEIAVHLFDRRSALNAMPKPAVLPDILHHVHPVMVESAKLGECLCCGGSAPDAGLVADVGAALQATSRTEYVGLVAEVAKLETAANNVLTLLGQLEARLVELQGIGAVEADLPALLATYDAAEATLGDLRAAKDAWVVVQKAESAALDADRQQLEWKATKEACENAMALTLDKALTTFIGRVQSYLPKGDTFDLRLRDGDREVVQFGLVRNDTLHTALSGAEWARVTAAMASACVAPGQYACIIPEERAFDASTLREVLTALGSTPHQVILTSPVAPKTVPKGWTVVRRGE